VGPLVGLEAKSPNDFAGVFCILGSIKKENNRPAGMIETVLYKRDISRESEEDEEEHL
jgi:hypothetical protein